MVVHQMMEGANLAMIIDHESAKEKLWMMCIVKSVVAVTAQRGRRMACGAI